MPIRDILSMRRGECKFCITENTPFLFCGDPVLAGSVYCEPHDDLCYNGFGCDVKQLEGAIYASDKSVVRQRVRGVVAGGQLIGRDYPAESPITLPVDVVIGGGG